MKTATKTPIVTRSNEELITAEAEAWITRLREIKDRRIELLGPIEDELAALDDEAASIRETAYSTIVEQGWSKVPALDALLQIVNGKKVFNQLAARAEMSKRTYDRVRSENIDTSKVKKFFPGIYRRNCEQTESHLRINGL